LTTLSSDNQAAAARARAGKRTTFPAWTIAGFLLPAFALVSLVVWALSGDPLSVQTEIRRTALALEQLALDELAGAIARKASEAVQRPAVRGRAFKFSLDDEGIPRFSEPLPLGAREIRPLPGDDAQNRSFRFLLLGFEERDLVQNDAAGAEDVLRLLNDRFDHESFQVRIRLAAAAFLIRHDRFDEAASGLFALIDETDPAAAPDEGELPFVVSAFLLLDGGLTGEASSIESDSASFGSVRARLVEAVAAGRIPLRSAELRAVAAESRSLTETERSALLLRAGDLDLEAYLEGQPDRAGVLVRSGGFAAVLDRNLWIGQASDGRACGAVLPAETALPALLDEKSLDEAGQGFEVALRPSGPDGPSGEGRGETIRTVTSPAGLEGARLDVILVDRTVFESSVRSRRTMLFVTASLLVVAMAVLGFTTLRAVRREMAAAKARSDFMAAVSHELRTPLASIRMFAELLDQGRVSDKDTEGRFMRLILSNCRRLSAMIENVLDLSRAERGVMRFHPEEVDLKGLLKELFRDIGAAAEEEGFSVEATVADDLPVVRADPLALARAVFNICDNALKYSGEGKRVTIKAARKNGGAEISIRDSGPGIPAAEREAVFERFHRGRAGAGSSGGAGLGLSLAREAVEACSGRLRLKSREGEGTEFFIYLPGVETDHE